METHRECTSTLVIKDRRSHPTQSYSLLGRRIDFTLASPLSIGPRRSVKKYRASDFWIYYEKATPIVNALAFNVSFDLHRYWSLNNWNMDLFSSVAMTTLDPNRIRRVRTRKRYCRIDLHTPERESRRGRNAMRTCVGTSFSSAILNVIDFRQCPTSARQAPSRFGFFVSTAEPSAELKAIDRRRHSNSKLTFLIVIRAPYTPARRSHDDR
ncbi:hypothetical protein EVAR_80000_1 [Eumeta japonica]|uniref:Uncharacterized protein n=1 Tax=Eumeta variegata TaxID=151549 RepID=A0A4C1WKC6_EUMVA|nr:hypothetical protein EVAR_80000_1 [Eumeta japonica]